MKVSAATAKETILVLPDIHFPEQDDKALAGCGQLADKSEHPGTARQGPVQGVHEALAQGAGR